MVTLTNLESSSEYDSCVTETPICEEKNIDRPKAESTFDAKSFKRPYTMRLFNRTIMVFEYIFPSTAEVVSKYASLLGIRNKTRLAIARAAVQVESVTVIRT